MKRGCEITVSMEKEDLSFKMNERSSFLLPFRRGYIAKVLEDAGVYKCTDEGIKAFKRFISTL